MDLVLQSLDGPVGTITLNHEPKRNVLSELLVNEIVGALDDFSAQGVRVVVLRAATGAAVWSAGHDVAELPEKGRDPLGWADPLRFLVRQIEQFPAPVIALVEGSVWGGACEVAFACDLLICAPDVTFALTPARHGVPYNVSGMLTFLNAAPLRILKEMAYSARPMDAARAERLGMVNHVVPAAQIEAFTYELAAEIAGNAPLSVSVMKEQLRILAGAHALSPEAFERVQGLRRIVYDSEDYREGLRAFREKRKPQFTGQ